MGDFGNVGCHQIHIGVEVEFVLTPCQAVLLSGELFGVPMNRSGSVACCSGQLLLPPSARQLRSAVCASYLMIPLPPRRFV